MIQSVLDFWSPVLSWALTYGVGIAGGVIAAVLVVGGLIVGIAMLGG